ncbi:hypothetical protein ACFFRR_011451 [Megaselia abdita]
MKALGILLVIGLFGCSFSADPCANQPVNSHLPIAGDCVNFIICGDKVTVSSAACQPNTYFDPTYLYCTTVRPAGCPLNPGPGSTPGPTTLPTLKTTTSKQTTLKTTTSKQTPGPTTLPTLKTTTSKQTPGPTTLPTLKTTTSKPTPGPSPSSGNCACNAAYLGQLVSYIDDCTKFCVCQFYDEQGLNEVLTCPSGLYFNPDLKTCDWPLSANCPYAS